MTLYRFGRPTAHMVTCLVIFSLYLPFAANGQERIDPIDIARIEMVGAAVVSPDGQYVAHSVILPANPLEENVASRAELRILNVNTGAQQTVETTMSAANLAFRPVRNTVTFTTRFPDDNASSLYEVSTTGTEPEKLFEFETNLMGYQWSPDGNRVAFMANEPVETTPPALPYQPEIYEEGLVQRRSYVVDLTASPAAARRIQVEGSVYLLAWSHDGRQIALSAAPTPMIDDFYMFQKVRVVDAATLQLQHEIDNAGKIDHISWSPDGQRLALLAGHDLNDPIAGRIMVVPSSGGTPRNIFPDFEGKFEQISWTGPQTIHFIASEGVWSTFGTIRPDGTGFQRIVEPGGAILNTFSRAGNGSVAFVSETPQHPREVYFLQPGANHPRRLTDTNPWLASAALGRQEVIRYPARDGLEIEGLLIHPLEDTGGPYPLITVVHGGPEAHYSNGWLTSYSVPGQAAAARGIAVFYPNYRGSTGRGLVYTKSSQGDLAGAEFDDIVDGVDYLIERGIADRDRVGVTGGSYGGYATAWMSTYYSDRFAAGVMFVGISNNISKWGTSDIPEELYLVHSRKRIWDYWEDNLRRSPIFYVERAQTPLLIMHGKDDTRVHPAQSLEIYRHLRVRKPEVPVRLVFYPGEGHGNIRATSRFDYNLRMMEWFETFLQGDGRLPPAAISVDAVGVSAN